MSELRNFVADLLERKGAAVDAAVDPDGLEVLAPPSVQKATGWPELTRLGFGRERGRGTIPIGLEGDWLDRFGALLGDEGRWSEREVRPPVAVPPPSDPERVLDRALDLPNAVWRFQGMTATWTRCLMLTFRYTAVSDEKREGLIWLGFNLGTGAVVSDILARLRPALAKCPTGVRPIRRRRRAAGPGMERGDPRGAAASAARSAGARRHRAVSARHAPPARARPQPRPCLSRRPAQLVAQAACGARLVQEETGLRPSGGARLCGSRRSSANTAPSSTICATTTPFASPSNGSRRWTSTCRCSASMY